MNARRAIAGALIRLAHRVYRPIITEMPDEVFIWTDRGERGTTFETVSLRKPGSAMQDYLQRRESRGWN